MRLHASSFLQREHCHLLPEQIESFWCPFVVSVLGCCSIMLCSYQELDPAGELKVAVGAGPCLRLRITLRTFAAFLMPLV